MRGAELRWREFTAEDAEYAERKKWEIRQKDAVGVVAEDFALVRAELDEAGFVAKSGGGLADGLGMTIEVRAALATEDTEGGAMVVERFIASVLLMIGY